MVTLSTVAVLFFFILFDMKNFLCRLIRENHDMWMKGHERQRITGNIYEARYKLQWRFEFVRTKMKFLILFELTVVCHGEINETISQNMSFVPTHETLSFSRQKCYKFLLAM